MTAVGDRLTGEVGTSELCARALAAGFALCGVASRERLQGIPAGADPEAVLPGYRAVLLLAATPDRVHAGGPWAPPLPHAPLLDALTGIVEDLRQHGHQAKAAGDARVSLPRLAVAAGLGELSPVETLVAKDHGLSLTLFGLLTDAPIVLQVEGSRGDPSGTSGGDCRECGLCLEDCPAMLPGTFQREWCTACGVCVAVCPA